MRVGLIVGGILFLSGFLIQLFAQDTGSLSGTVIDIETKRPIKGVNVAVENTSISTVTDSKGKFEIKKIPAGEYSLRFSVSGYGERRISVTISPKVETSVVVTMKPIASKAVPITETPVAQTTEARTTEPKTQPKSTTPEPIRYERKSISYANVVLTTNPDIKIDEKQANYIIKKFREYIEMPRFDYNPIPNELLSEFEFEVKSRGTRVTLDEVVEILKEKFVPKIIEILDIEKEMRAQNLVTEAQRNSFIATKAKTLGITAEQLMKVMNSAFIYIPVISDYKTEEVRGALSITINAGAIWYRVTYDESGASDLKLVVKKETMGIGVAKIGKDFKHEGEKVNDKEYAFRTAVIALARDLQVATREIPEFQLGAQVIEVYPNHVTFPMGAREGIKIDDGFDLVEVQENPDGEINFVKVGFARVTYVANNRTNPGVFSRAQIIIGRGLEPGIYVSERPKLPIDLVGRILNNPFTVKLNNPYTGETITTNKMTGISIGVDLLYDLGRNINVPQFWVGGGFSFGTGSVENLDIIKNIFWGQEPNVLIVELRGALVKKFYFKRFCALGRVDLILEETKFSKDEDELSHSSLGLGFGIGGEYVVTPDLNLGFNVGYRLFSESEEWSLGGITGTVTGLSGDHSGVVFSIYANYSLPRLGFDPIAVIKGVLPW